MRPTFASFVNQAYINVRNAGIIGFPNNVNLRMKHLSFLHMLTTKSLPLCTDCGFWILRCLHHKYFFAISEKRGSLLTFNFSFGITTSGRRQRIHSMPLFTKAKNPGRGRKIHHMALCDGSPWKNNTKIQAWCSLQIHPESGLFYFLPLLSCFHNIEAGEASQTLVEFSRFLLPYSWFSF